MQTRLSSSFFHLLPFLLPIAYSRHPHSCTPFHLLLSFLHSPQKSEDGGLDLGLEAPKERRYPLLRCKPPSTAALLHTTATPLHAIGAGTDNGKRRWSGQRIHKIKKD
ncbi:hypothetical protein LXL04_013576 [Taraxacum kok-saghyz]